MKKADKEFEKIYRDKMIKEKILPEGWTEQYEILACLKDTPGKKTYLLKAKGKDDKYILKCADKEEAPHLLEEGKIIQELRKLGETEMDIKRLEEENGRIFLLRNYIEGKSLARIGEMRSFPEKEICRTGILICESVMRFHMRKPPIIHRDIKPENIIIKESGELVLIDLETARVYKEGKQADTYFAGTRETAAPEQYGFGQTDERTDIYGIGATLLYMKTGDYFLEDLHKAGGSRRLKKIIRKCCSFDPADRFRSVEKVSAELQKGLPDIENESRSVKLLTGAVILLCAAVIGLFCQVASLKEKIDSGGEEKRKENKAVEELQKPEQDREDVQAGNGRLYIRGWDVTGYEQILGQILSSSEQRDYQLMMTQCRQLISALYADEFLQNVEAEDVYYYSENDARWEGYDIVRTGYEQIADDLAYHDRMLESNLDNFEQYKYHIAALVRGSVESTRTARNGELIYTPLYHYKYEGNLEELDYSLDCLLDAIIRGIELYWSEKNIE